MGKLNTRSFINTDIAIETKTLRFSTPVSSGRIAHRRARRKVLWDTHVSRLPTVRCETDTASS